MPAAPAEVSRTDRHRPRSMIALLPEVNDALVELADERRQPARWALHDILLAYLVAQGRITQDRSDELWRSLTRRRRED